MSNLMVAYLAMGIAGASLNFLMQNKGWAYAPVTAFFGWPFFLFLVLIVEVIEAFEKREQYWWRKP